MNLFNLLRSLEPEQKPTLVEMISILLADREPMVLSAAIWAFQQAFIIWSGCLAAVPVLSVFSCSFFFHQVCPDRWDLLHPHFRKYCHLLADLDEWGAVVALQVLTHYCRLHFVAPPATVCTGFLRSCQCFGSVLMLTDFHTLFLFYADGQLEWNVQYWRCCFVDGARASNSRSRQTILFR